MRFKSICVALMALILFVLVILPAFAIGERSIQYNIPGIGNPFFPQGTLGEKKVTAAIPSPTAGATVVFGIIVPGRNIVVTDVNVWFFTLPTCTGGTATMTLDVLKIASGGSSGTSVLAAAKSMLTGEGGLVAKTGASLTLSTTAANRRLASTNALYGAVATGAGTTAAAGTGGIVTVTYYIL